MMTSSIKGTLYSTAKARLDFNPGTGSTIDVTSCDSQRVTRVSGFREAINCLDIFSLEMVDKDKVDTFDRDYITVTLTNDDFVSRFELSDFLNGSGWKLNGYSVTMDTHTDLLWNHMIWFRAKEKSKSKKSPREQSAT